MTTGLVHDERFHLHRAPYEHPEKPERLEAIESRLAEEALMARCRRVPAREAATDELERVHTSEHVQAIDRTAGDGFLQLDPDTYAGPRSAAAARLAAGALIDLTGEVVAGSLRNGLALLRPPGHHAEADAAMGFCLYNNVAVAAAAARAGGVERVLVVDWDLHHGNGTQRTFWNDPSVLYFSTHQFPFYPGTGSIDEVGGQKALGATVNVPWPGGMGDPEYLAAFRRVLLPIAWRFEPELVLVSCGFDASAGDPLGSMRVTPNGFARLTAELQPLAGGRLLLALEGGYNLEAISRSAAACLRVLLDEPPAPVDTRPPNLVAERVLQAVIRAQEPFWPHLSEAKE